MQERAVANKNYATYIGGLFTEATPLNFPDNTVQTTQNFRYDPSGYIERREGLEYEECGISVETDKGCIETQAFRWRSVSNRKDLDIIVFQYGTKLVLELERDYDCYDKKCTIDLMDHSVESADENGVATSLISMSYGNGSLFVTGKYIKPFRVDYTPETASTVCDEHDETGCKVTEIKICERDFEGVDDGLALDEHPKELSDKHLYNLLNRGWTIEHIYEYFDKFGEYPSNSEYHHLGWTTDNEGHEVWKPDDVRTASTGSSSAPQGHIIRNIFDTCDQNCSGSDEEGEEEEKPKIDVIDIGGFGGWVDTNTVTIKTATPHRLEAGDVFTLTDGNHITNVWCSESHVGTDITTTTGVQEIDLDGVYTNYTIIDDRTVEITLSTTIEGSDCLSAGGGLGASTSVDLGKMQITSIIPENMPCCVETYRPRVNAFYAGRLWHMSMDSDRIGTNVYFSQVIRNHEDEGQAYQDQDPTAKDYNELLKSDGGVISIPEMGRVLEARVMKDSLLLFAENGIWSISGAYNGYFDATAYVVSKLTDVGCISRKSVVDIEDTIVYASSRGIYIISPQTRTQSITEKQIHTKYRLIPLHNKEHIRIVYHKYDKTLHVLYACGECRYKYDRELVYNTRSTAWYEYIYTKQEIVDVFLTKNHHVIGRGLNYLVKDGNNIDSYYMTNCEYLDFKSKDLVKAYLHTAPETLGDLLYKKFIEKQVFFFDNIVDSACNVTHVWDFKNVDEPCKESGQEITFDSPCYVVNKDILIEEEGRIQDKPTGIALSLEMATVGQKHCKIYGWATHFESAVKYKPGRDKPIRRKDRRYK